MKRSGGGQWAAAWWLPVWIVGVLSSPLAAQQLGDMGDGSEAFVHVTWGWPRDGQARVEASWERSVAALASWWLDRELTPPHAGMPSTAGAWLGPSPDGGLAWRFEDQPPRALRNAQARAAVHRRALATQVDQDAFDGPHVVVLEVLLDFNSMRRVAPGRMAAGDGSDLLSYWKLSNTRDVMLHVRTTPRPSPLPMVLTVDVTWASRSDPLDVAEARRVSLPLGPIEAVEVAREGDAWVVRLPLDLRLVIARALASSMAARFDDDDFERDALRWARSMRDRLTRMQAVLSGEVIISGGQDGPRVRVALARERGGRSVASDVGAMQRVLAQQRDSAPRSGVGAG